MVLVFGFTTMFVLFSSTVMALDYYRKSVVGHFNHDTFLDRVISDPMNDELFIWFGKGPSWVSFGTEAGVAQALSTLPELSLFSEYFPGKGKDDIYEGWGARFSTSITREDLDSEDLDSPFSALGASMAVGDFNGDGLDDLVVGMPLSTVNGQKNAGKVAIFFGGPSFPLAHRLISQGTRDWGLRVWGEPEAGDQFGEALATGDFNCDGYSDLAIGVPKQDIGAFKNAGLVHLIYGSIIGLYSSDDRLWEKVIPDEEVTAYDHFGYALTSGRFNGNEICDGLAVGAPGEEIDGHKSAGAVFVFYPEEGKKLNPSNVDKIHQNSGLVKSRAEDYDRFGSSLGKIVHSTYDGLWIGAVGEDSSTCNPIQTFYHRLEANSSGIDIHAEDRAYCGLFPPDLVERSVGIVSEFITDYGSIAFYFPNKDPSEMELTVLIPGSGSEPAPPGDSNNPYPCTTNPLVYLHYSAWITAAINANEALVTPQFDNKHFGNLNECLNDPDGDGIPTGDYITSSGYRALWGHPIGADDWVNHIVDDLQKIGFETDGKFKLFGHSAGGQFVSRYLWKHAERTTRVIIEAPGSYLKDINDAWASGLGEYSRWQHWPNNVWKKVRYNPILDMGKPNQRWPAIMQRPIRILIGEEDGVERDKHTGDITQDDCNRLNIALQWQTDLNSKYGGHPGTEKIEFCVYKGGNHWSKTTSDEAASWLINGLPTGNCIACPAVPSRCLDDAPYPYTKCLELDIRVNNVDGPVTVSQGDTFSVSLSLDPAGHEGQIADWWLAALTTSGWVSFVVGFDAFGWEEGLHCITLPLVSFSNLGISQPPLSTGQNYIFFAADDNSDGFPDVTWADYVQINVQ